MPANNNEVVVESTIASAMGAKVTIVGPERSMYLIISHSRLPDSLVRSAGGEVALRLNGGKMLAILPYMGYLSLQGNYQVSHIGPVTIDVNRLARLTETLAKVNNSKHINGS